MVCACSLYFNVVYFLAIYGYPCYKVKNGEQDKIWPIYFLILGIFSFLENTALFPLKWLLDKICFCMFPTLKSLFFLWLYSPQYKGALLLDKLFGKYIDMAYEKLNPIIGKFVESLGIKNQGDLSSSIKSKIDSTISSVKDKIDSGINNLRNKPNKKDIIQRTRKLNNGIDIPLIGLGTSRINNIVDVIYGSIKDGLRLIDTAVYYKNEAEVGEGLKKVLDEGIVKREELFIIGKLWIDDRNNPEKGIRETLKKLQLDYLDLYLDHWPSGINLSDPENFKDQISIYDVWPKLEELVEKGLTRSIGCSNYNVQSLLNLLSFCKIKPAANEVEFHPYFYQKNLKDFCDKENITLIAYYPLAKGNGAKIYIKEHQGEFDIFEDNCVKQLSEKYNKTKGQIILNWEVSQGIVTIPGTSNPKRMEENMDIFDFKMDEDEINNLGSYGKKMKFCGCRRFFGYNIMA